jgi:predicted NUDIX family NTP pyrophosphohydrolase
MPKQSAGILLHKITNGQPLFFLVHPGGPFYKNKDAGSWTIPKGEFSEGEEPLAAALREFTEETGFAIEGHFIQLQPIKQKSGKTVHCWAVEGDIDPAQIQSNTFEIEWPPKSGQWQSFPEIDRAAWFTYDEALQKIIPAQLALLDDVMGML